MSLSQKRQAGASERTASTEVGFEDFDHAQRMLRELFERWDNRLTWPVNILKEYCRGALRIVIKFEAVPGRDVCDGDKIGTAADEGTACHLDHGSSGWIINGEGGGSGGFYHEGQNGVLVHYVQLVEGIESVALSSWENFERDEKVFYPITGCFYSFATGFVVNPVIARAKYEVAILCAAIDTNGLSRHMVESGANVVDSIAYYEGQILSGVANKPDSNFGLSGLGVVLDRDSVRLRGYVSGKLGLKVVDMLIGPFDL